MSAHKTGLSQDELNKLLVEYGKAHSCQERAYFFASKLTTEEVDNDGNAANNAAADNAATDNAAADNAAADNAAADNAAAGNAAAGNAAVGNAAVGNVAAEQTTWLHAKCAEITNIYSDARLQLLGRFKEVTEEYKSLIGDVELYRWFPVKITDRNYDFVLESKKIVNDRFKKLADEIINANSLKTTSPLFLEKCCRTWTGLDNICRLLMDEISFLCERVGNLQNTINARKGVLLAVASIAASIAVTLFSTGVSALYSWYGMFLDHDVKWGLPIKNEREDVAKAIHSEFKNLSTDKENVGAIKSDLDYLRGAFVVPSPSPKSERISSPMATPAHSSGPDVSSDLENIEAALKQISQSVGVIASATYKDNLPQVTILNELGTLNKTLSSIKDTLPEFSKPTPIPSVTPDRGPKTKDVLNKANELDKKIDDLAKRVEELQEALKNRWVFLQAPGSSSKMVRPKPGSNPNGN